MDHSSILQPTELCARDRSRKCARPAPHSAIVSRNGRRRLALIRSGRPIADHGSPHGTAEIADSREPPGPRPPARARAWERTHSANRSHPGCGSNPLARSGSKPFLVGNKPIWRRRAPDRSQFRGGTDPFRAAGARTEPLFPRIEAIFEGGRRIEANLHGGSKPIPMGEPILRPGRAQPGRASMQNCDQVSNRSRRPGRSVVGTNSGSARAFSRGVTSGRSSS
jgi:hypothetical protein